MTLVFWAKPYRSGLPGVLTMAFGGTQRGVFCGVAHDALCIRDITPFFHSLQRKI